MVERRKMLVHLQVQGCPISGPVSTQCVIPDSKVHGAYIGPTWGRHDPGGLHVGPMNLAIRDFSHTIFVGTV